MTTQLRETPGEVLTMPTAADLLVFCTEVRKEKGESPAKLQRMVDGILGRLAEGEETVEGLLAKQQAKYGRAVRVLPQSRPVKTFHYGGSSMKSYSSPAETQGFLGDYRQHQSSSPAKRRSVLSDYEQRPSSPI
jgi:hypothetical protein